MLTDTHAHLYWESFQEDLDANDGGNSATYYEIGSDPGLDL